MLRSCSILLGAVLLVAAVGCNRIRVEDVRGPDGGAWVRISCRHMDRRCYQTASRMCPSGFYFANAGGAAPTPAREPDAEDDDGEATVGSAPAPQAGVNTKTLPPQESWSREMYSRESGALLVRCAAAGERTASN